MLEFALKISVLIVLGAVAIYLSWKEIKEIEAEEERSGLNEFIYLQNVVSINKLNPKSRRS